MATQSDELPDYHSRVVIDPEILAGKPVIAGTRIPVSLILNLLAHDYRFERIIEAYPNLSDDDIKSALAYAQARMDPEEELQRRRSCGRDSSFLGMTGKGAERRGGVSDYGRK